jgi:hypothetical protein
MSRRIIFLDVDGVLNNRHTRVATGTGWCFVDDFLVARVREIVDATGALIVLSSTWRDDWNVEDESRNGSDFNELRAKFREFGMDFYDRTGAWQIRGRGWEILAWLAEHEAVESFVILDDWNDMGPVRNHLIWTNPSLGLTEDQVQEAIEILLQNS